MLAWRRLAADWLTDIGPDGPAVRKVKAHSTEVDRQLGLIGYVDFLSDMLFPVILVLLLSVLLFRPAGLFGTEKVERV